MTTPQPPEGHRAEPTGRVVYTGRSRSGRTNYAAQVYRCECGEELTGFSAVTAHWASVLYARAREETP